MSPTTKILKDLKVAFGSKKFHYREVSDYLRVSTGLAILYLTSNDSVSLGVSYLGGGWYKFDDGGKQL